jgi:hypothetical protein
MRPDLEGLAPEEGGGELPDLDHADHVVRAALAHGKPGVPGPDQGLPDGELVVVEIDSVHVRARRHDARTARSASRITPEIILRSSVSITPAV